MKLLYVANMRMPTEKAHSIQAMQMCAAFVGSNFEVELVAPRRFNKIKSDPFEYYAIERSFKITKLPCLDLIPWLGHFGLWIETASFQVSLFFYLLFKKADIVYTRDKSCLLPAFFKKNVFFEAHTFPKNYFLYSFWINKAQGIITITKGLAELFLAKGIKPENILTAPDSVDLAKFKINEGQAQCREKLGLPLDKKIILYTGHLYSWKGVDILAEAANYLGEDVAVYFVGGAEEDIEKFKVQPASPRQGGSATCLAASRRELKVSVVGHRPHSEIPYWMGAADVLVLPNSGKEEISRAWTSPLKMFEYMASNRPIVASDLPSIREALNGNNAVLVKPDDALALAQGIKAILENTPLAQQISQAAFQDVQQCTWQSRAQKIVQFFSASIK
ncbi:MAG: glycosyltransferase [Patescibacteria group bacterium]